MCMQYIPQKKRQATRAAGGYLRPSMPFSSLIQKLMGFFRHGYNIILYCGILCVVTCKAGTCIFRSICYGFTVRVGSRLFWGTFVRSTPKYLVLCFIVQGAGCMHAVMLRAVVVRLGTNTAPNTLLSNTNSNNNDNNKDDRSTASMISHMTTASINTSRTWLLGAEEASFYTDGRTWYQNKMTSSFENAGVLVYYLYAPSGNNLGARRKLSTEVPYLCRYFC